MSQYNNLPEKMDQVQNCSIVMEASHIEYIN